MANNIIYKTKYGSHSPHETRANVKSRANIYKTKFSPQSPLVKRANVKSRANNMQNKI